MQIDYNILIAYGGVAKKVDKGEYIFREGVIPNFYFQVVQGEVKVFSSNNEGRELTQGIFSEGQSFGEPPLLLNRPYPSSAQATKPGVIVKIGREKLNHILSDFPDLVREMMMAFAERIYDKASFAQIWVCHTPEEKIEQFLIRHKQKTNSTDSVLIPFTRQQIADFTGLRVETVIRTLKKMCERRKVKIIEHKLYF